MSKISTNKSKQSLIKLQKTKSSVPMLTKEHECSLWSHCRVRKTKWQLQLAQLKELKLGKFVTKLANKLHSKQSCCQMKLAHKKEQIWSLTNKSLLTRIMMKTINVIRFRRRCQLSRRNHYCSHSIKCCRLCKCNGSS